DVIHVDDHPTLGNFCSEYIIHHSLEHCQGVKHHQRFKKTSIHPECSLPLITIFNPDVVIPPANIHLREVLRFR
ncbi:hypothetical protein AMATHDRAFT_146263, partial [Amanita thiersii Skay4041]